MKARTDEDKRIGQLIRASRIAAGLSQERLAEQLGLTFQQVQKYEKGVNRISGSRLLQASKYLGVSVGYLIGEADSAPSGAVLNALATKEGQSLIASFNAIAAGADRLLVVTLAKRLAVL